MKGEHNSSPCQFSLVALELIIRIHPKPHKLHKAFAFIRKYFPPAMAIPTKKEHGVTWWIRSLIVDYVWFIFSPQTLRPKIVHGPVMIPRGVLNPTFTATLWASFLQRIKVNHYTYP
ncbi:MAG TPA: hypothetical protein VN456_08130, partial [Desulfosporosinus sp.]|nr:hypothetical protein [Desulfosporosinus sp.]